jgi:hypothetical protein
MIEYTDVLTIGLAIVTIARVVVKLTPTKKDDNFMIKFLKIVEGLGLPDVQAKKVSKKRK